MPRKANNFRASGALRVPENLKLKSGNRGAYWRAVYYQSRVDTFYNSIGTIPISASVREMSCQTCKFFSLVSASPGIHSSSVSSRQFTKKITEPKTFKNLNLEFKRVRRSIKNIFNCGRIYRAVTLTGQFGHAWLRVHATHVLIE